MTLKTLTTPSIWVIGDVQGCDHALAQLLAHPTLNEDPNAHFWFAGDLVNRGPQSLASLRRIMALGDRAVTVLGNHDLHLLGVAAGVRALHESDTIAEILQAPDAPALLDWIRTRPLAYYDPQHHCLLVHAGVLAQWDIAKTLRLATEVQAALSGKNWQQHIKKMFGNQPVQWRKAFDTHAHKYKYKRMRVTINALTRMRLCTPKHCTMVLTKKALSETKRSRLVPWFDVPHRATRHQTIVFGHWSDLGLLRRKHVICLDTGCVWGGALTALRLQDRALVQVACQSSMLKVSSPIC